MAEARTLEPPPMRQGPTREQLLRHLRRAQAVAARAVAMGHHPFGAILVGPDQETVLLEQGNVSTVNHAEAVLARTADMNFTPEYLWGCTLYTTVEPCAMCAATQYWANIGRLVYGLEERRLQDLTAGSPENPTLDVPARYIYAHSRKAIEVIGPVPEVEEEIAELHRTFWNRPSAP
ncbi:MAG: nucleoside deaminase [Geothrix sp.]|nr:nucleoside deaminase [Geothrix sp.]